MDLTDTLKQYVLSTVALLRVVIAGCLWLEPFKSWGRAGNAAPNRSWAGIAGPSARAWPLPALPQ